MAQHTNVSPLTPTQKLEFAVHLRACATLKNQADTKDPQAAVDFLLWLATRYEASAK
jgi:hypothetical protein